jgi:type IV pilus assembly protein PilP
VFSALTLVACGEVEQNELEEWMQEQRKLTPSTIAPITAPKTFVSASYEAFAADDPFDELKLKRVLDRLRSSTNNSTIKPDLSRKRDVLESYPLDAIKMVGFMIQKNKPTAILSASGVLFNAVLGEHIGQDFGKIVEITEQEVSFKELVQDASGVWVKRDSKLALTIAPKDT